MKILIQFEGFIVSSTSRTYNFRVIDAPGQSRQCSVQVPSESFRSTPLKFQDGPGISFDRLEQELGREAPAEAHLRIGDQDIQEYLERHYPRKRSKYVPPTFSVRPLQ